MKVQFNVHYHTQPGQQIAVCGSAKELGAWDSGKVFRLNYTLDGNWSGTIDIKNTKSPLEYKYLLLTENGENISEWGENREISLGSVKQKSLILFETWRAPSKEEKVFFSSAFSKAVMKPNESARGAKSNAKKVVRFKIQVPRIGDKYQVCILGNIPKLGNWDKSKPLLLECGKNFPEWSGDINTIGLSFPIKYKYGIYDVVQKQLVTLEDGNDRYFDMTYIDEDNFLFVKSDESFNYPVGNWKGAGVSLPVFSLRSDKSFGVGEFNDLFDFIDWAKSVGMKMVQLLPVNETVASHNWLDSYPYKSISVTALHPFYLNLEKMGALNDEAQMKFFAEKQAGLNAKKYVDYPEVHQLKSKYFKLLFDQEKETFFKEKEYKVFFEANKDWLVPYAVFDYLRDKFKSADFRTWDDFSVYNKNKIEQMSRPQAEEWDDIAIHYFIQFHLDKQLSEVAKYARENGIVLKGDIPIGISPNSVEAWTEPHLFNLQAQAGAPPDDFAIKGQNWGFPTYNWDKMAEEGYAWWKGRLKKMAEYFNAYRIDHILGFFRIWEIPKDAVEGLLGYFNPALPLTAEEIEGYGVRFDYERMVKPYIPHHLIENKFGHLTGIVIEKFLEPTTSGRYKLKEDYDTQQKVNSYFLDGIEEEDLRGDNLAIRNGLFDLVANVLFVQTGENQWHPRISISKTTSYEELDWHTKIQMDKLYVDYFYRRHDDFWYHKGMEKLPVIMEASNMLVCGEDLGMVPNCVPPVMDQLNILSLEIQRMSKNPKVKFAHPADAPYLSVCTTSTHDMSTIRGWWEENRELIQQFYNVELGNSGAAPYFAEPDVCKQMIVQHLYSPAMWTTFPIQDLIAIDGELRWENTQDEQINHPDNVRHKWRFRLHQSIDDLKNAREFNELLRTLLKESGRNSEY